MTASGMRLGLRANARQFWLLVLVNAFVGSMIGLERDVVPLMGRETFHLASQAAIVSFIVTFGFTKAVANLYAGFAADKLGRKPLLIVGWLAAMPVPFLLMSAPSWGWVLFANALLGVNQGFCWSMTVVMKIDLVGPKQRGLAMGLNEFAGYLAVAAAAYASGVIAQAYGLRPWPFVLGIATSVLALLLTVVAVRETRGHAHFEASIARRPRDLAATFGHIFRRVSWNDRTLSSISQAGLVNNLNDGLIWGILPLYFISCGLSINEIALIAALYPATWGICQIGSGALSDRIGRKWLIAGGMWLQAGAIALFIVRGSFVIWVIAAIVLGFGTALVYPTLLAAIGDVVDPRVRSSSVGVYRLWRDSGYAFGALISGMAADRIGHGSPIIIVSILTFTSGVIVALRMRETHRYAPIASLPAHGAATQ